MPSVSSVPPGSSKSPNHTACFACFIRLRSGIANSLQANRPPDRGADMHESTMRLWQPHG